MPEALQHYLLGAAVLVTVTALVLLRRRGLGWNGKVLLSLAALALAGAGCLTGQEEEATSRFLLLGLVAGVLGVSLGYMWYESRRLPPE